MKNLMQWNNLLTESNEWLETPCAEPIDHQAQGTQRADDCRVLSG